MKCRFCGEGDEEKLCLDMIAVEGRVEWDSVICMNCLWWSRFRPKVENGKPVLSEGEATRGIKPFRDVHTFKL